MCEYYSCFRINSFYVNFHGRIDLDEKCVTLCCERGIKDLPGVELRNTGEETVESFIALRSKVIEEGQYLPTDERTYTNGCQKCAVYQQKEWGGATDCIGYVNLSMYPAPCNAKCIYCPTYKSDFDTFAQDAVKIGYERFFDAIDYMIDNNMVKPEAPWQISSGEITIHPYKDRILEVCEGRRCTFLTNCLIYDESIGNILSSNPKSAINLSIDAGTSETWQQVKGVDNFCDVVENLQKYHKQCQQATQITLKYIVLPGINDNEQDYMGVIDIMKSIGVKKLTVGRNTTTKYTITEDERKKLTTAAGKLCMQLKENNIAFDINAYTADEQNKVMFFTDILSKKGEAMHGN